MIKNIFIILLLSNGLYAFSQNSNLDDTLDGVNTSTNETVFLHSNATSFVCGETLNYKLYCLNPKDFTPSKISKIAYSMLIGKEGQILLNQKMFLKNGTGNGDFFIPTTIATGSYKLIAYTNWMLNKSNSKFYEVDITIINPYQINPENKINSNSVFDEQLVSPNSESGSLNLNKNEFSVREKINLTINLAEQYKNGSYSLSVRKKEDLPSIKPINSIDFSARVDSSFINITNAILPELRGEIISGKISTKNELFRLNDISIALSNPSKSFEFKIVKTDKNGRFIFNIDKPYTESNFFIQVFDGNKNEYSINIDNKNLPDISSIIYNNNYKLDSKFKTIIEKRSIANQVENAFYNIKLDSVKTINTDNIFYSSFAKDYILDNYTRFSTLKETTIEIVKEMYYTKKGEDYSLHLNDYDPNIEVSEPALVLIDGLLVQNVNELFDYKTDNIYKISIIPGGYYYGGKLFNGVISFITKNNDYQTKAFGNYIAKPNIIVPNIEKIYYKEDYSDKNKNSRIPDYREQLLWMPYVKINKELSFFSSDITGIFEIVFEGFTNEGKPISLTKTIEIK